MTDQLQTNESSLNVTPPIAAFLLETAKWAKLISIVGFVGLGFMVFFGLFAGSIFSMIPDSTGVMPVSGAFFGFIYIGLAVLYFFPLYYLFQFSTKVKHAIQFNDQTFLHDSFEYLKSHYKFIGILVVIMLCFYALGLIIMVVAGGIGFMLGS